jgi:UDP-galactopyranose mutase
MRREFDVVCFSHLRWNFVFQRPQHLLSRCAKERRVFFIEEPLFENADTHLRVSESKESVIVVTPIIAHGTDGSHVSSIQNELITDFFVQQQIHHYVAWYYTPMALDWYSARKPIATIYDCMDELSAFKGAPPILTERERDLFKQADLVFTGGVSLYEHKKAAHPNVYAFPSSVDTAHFGQARDYAGSEPEDQSSIPYPRLGFFGVVDERFDIELLDRAAQLRPDFHFVIIGPVVKIDPATLPQRENIHYLGGKQYSELPAYLSGWDVALLLFARNESTRFISPTKTPEYLAAGKPVVSTSIRDVVRPYGERNYVRIADEPEAFVEACEAALTEDREERLNLVDPFIASMSWDRTWRSMAELIDGIVELRMLDEETEASHV